MLADGTAIRTRRTGLKLSQKRLGELAGVHRGSIRNIESGRPAMPSTLKRISDAMDAHEKEQGLVATAINMAKHTTSASSEIAAIAVVVDALSELSREEQRRVLNYINDRFDDGGES